MYSDSPFPSLSYAARNPFPCGDGLLYVALIEERHKTENLKSSHKGRVNETDARCKAVPEGEGGLP